MGTNTKNARFAATRFATHPERAVSPSALSESYPPGWLARCAIAIAAILFLWAAWPADGAGGLTAEEFSQMYEGGPPVDPGSPPPTFP